MHVTVRHSNAPLSMRGGSRREYSDEATESREEAAAAAAVAAAAVAVAASPSPAQPKLDAQRTATDDDTNPNDGTQHATLALHARDSQPAAPVVTASVQLPRPPRAIKQEQSEHTMFGLSTPDMHSQGASRSGTTGSDSTNHVAAPPVAAPHSHPLSSWPFNLPGQQSTPLRMPFFGAGDAAMRDTPSSAVKPDPAARQLQLQQQQMQHRYALFSANPALMPGASHATPKRKRAADEQAKPRLYNSCHICKCAQTDSVEHARCRCGVIFCSRPRCCRRLGVEWVEFLPMLANLGACVHCADPTQRSHFADAPCPNSNCMTKKKKGGESRKYRVGGMGDNHYSQAHANTTNTVQTAVQATQEKPSPQLQSESLDPRLSVRAPARSALPASTSRHSAALSRSSRPAPDSSWSSHSLPCAIPLPRPPPGAEHSVPPSATATGPFLGTSFAHADGSTDSQPRERSYADRHHLLQLASTLSSSSLSTAAATALPPSSSAHVVPVSAQSTPSLNHPSYSYSLFSPFPLPSYAADAALFAPVPSFAPSAAAAGLSYLAAPMDAAVSASPTSLEHVSRWSPGQVCGFLLQQLSLSNRFCAKFLAAGIDGSHFLQLSSAHLQIIGVDLTYEHSEWERVLQASSNVRQWCVQGLARAPSQPVPASQFPHVSAGGVEAPYYSQPQPMYSPQMFAAPPATTGHIGPTFASTQTTQQQQRPWRTVPGELAPATSAALAASSLAAMATSMAAPVTAPGGFVPSLSSSAPFTRLSGANATPYFIPSSLSATSSALAPAPAASASAPAPVSAAASYFHSSPSSFPSVHAPMLLNPMTNGQHAVASTSQLERPMTSSAHAATAGASLPLPLPLVPPNFSTAAATGTTMHSAMALMTPHDDRFAAPSTSALHARPPAHSSPSRGHSLYSHMQQQQQQQQPLHMQSMHAPVASAPMMRGSGRCGPDSAVPLLSAAAAAAVSGSSSSLLSAVPSVSSSPLSYLLAPVQVPILLPFYTTSNNPHATHTDNKDKASALHTQHASTIASSSHPSTASSSSHVASAAPSVSSLATTVSCGVVLSAPVSPAVLPAPAVSVPVRVPSSGCVSGVARVVPPAVSVPSSVSSTPSSLSSACTSGQPPRSPAVCSPLINCKVIPHRYGFAAHIDMQQHAAASKPHATSSTRNQHTHTPAAHAAVTAAATAATAAAAALLPTAPLSSTATRSFSLPPSTAVVSAAAAVSALSEGRAKHL